MDTLTVYRDRHGFPHRLENAIANYHLEGKVKNSHRAVDDCEALFEVAKAMERECDDLNTYVNVFGYSAKYGISGRTLKKVIYLRQGGPNAAAGTLQELLKKRDSPVCLNGYNKTAGERRFSYVERCCEKILFCGKLQLCGDDHPCRE